MLMKNIDVHNRNLSKKTCLLKENEYTTVNLIYKTLNFGVGTRLRNHNLTARKHYILIETTEAYNKKIQRVC